MTIHSDNEAATQKEQKSAIAGQNLTPNQIVELLDKYIIGQKDAKKSVAIALRNRLRRQHVGDELRDEIMPNNIIMIGPTGVGKTEIARRLAKLAKAPFVKVEASKFTEVGYVGRDVESMIRDLVDQSVAMVRSEKSEEVKEKAAVLVEDRLLDILLPPLPANRGVGEDDIEQDANSAAMVLGADNDQSQDINRKSREKMLERLRSGRMEDRQIEMDIAGENPGGMMQIFGPLGQMEEIGNIMQDLMSGLPRKRKKRRVTIAEARRILEQEEVQKLIDMDAVVKEAISKVEQSGIVFIDEIDKIAAPSTGAGGGKGPDVSREGVQRDLLPIVEGSNVATKYGSVKTDHVLFIASGAFHVAKPSDLIPELQGRFPIRVELKSLTEEDFYKILTQPKNALIKQYKALISTEGVDLQFTEGAILEIAKTAAKVNESVENIGARRLHTIMTNLLEELMFNIPESMSDENVIIDEAKVREKLSAIASDRDLSQYIL
ncbi:MAG: ATP-dependent protease ATPase subunit HslU [Chlorobium sp.]|jgi:ATP-dependent HslUV protease ATP-binding subunit HslU|uniref:ATP-dependent protease ATPase subunit HslU n=1 Tax=Chlorobium sp. TaxID=1095 RepID=UPI0025BD880B|nr:ATP-dependent protease ATPase subunit HslU [Chlorobium sp.]MCF8215821.1 ATP-dependent protease ATPase subunit HslU [Chlorobium sp.]MCF8270719.1 ATP-dependent protease ATPase subunit HslU [Chlorobium sp.]MCF8287031.1 ATP-dependent protease ATPase subunit HslU [Chlorobium sp.]MCF8290688.1 ATP-dependent protease ATPase subunit HslU [Chlorobium sp.]MCF8384792.1 ATP-dependent protease ATPase subunit HslU [Chlorobium sp.]